MGLISPPNPMDQIGFHWSRTARRIGGCCLLRRVVPDEDDEESPHLDRTSRRSCWCTIEHLPDGGLYERLYAWGRRRERVVDLEVRHLVRRSIKRTSST